MVDPAPGRRIRQTEAVRPTPGDRADLDEWLGSERALNEVQLGARLLRSLRARGIFKGLAR